MKNSLKFEVDKEKNGCSDSGGDFLPIHCIIQTFSSLNDLKTSHCQTCDAKNVSADCWLECDCKKNEMSGCVVVPESTSMDDLVRTALVKLGYPASVSSFATGSILIRNWKPLPFETICSDMKKTVADILGEVTAVVSLRIQIFKPEITFTQKMKDDLLLFLIKANQHFLCDSRCPFDLSLLSKFCDQPDYMKMHLLQEPPEDLQRKFEIWLEHVQDSGKASVARKPQYPNSFFFPSNNKSINMNDNQHLIREKGIQSPGHVELKDHDTPEKQTMMPSEKENVNFVKESNVMERPKQFATPKTRVRTSFDPEFELPKLQKWYRKNPHPTRQQVYEYVTELNSLESRKGRKQLDVNNVVYWFKNARAAQKRTECRRFSNVSTTETNRCNVLKIPLGKSCGVMPDDQRSISDDEATVTSDSGDECRQESERYLQVVGKWNSNGQGEAVLEMQIPSRKNDFAQPVAQTKKDNINDNEDNSRNTQEDTNDSIEQEGFTQKKDFRPGTSEKILNHKENRTVQVTLEKKSGIKISEVTGNKKCQKIEENKPSENLSKVPVSTTFPSFKEDSGATGRDFLSSYKPGFPPVTAPNSVLNPPFICMSQYINSKPNSLPLTSEERRKRNRTFIDPVTEVPRLEQWFRLSTHPSHSLITRYTEELNNMPYRRKFPKLEAKNVQFWFKNRRAKNKRLNYLEINNN